mgnify:CR=1 FL=1
MYPHPCPALTPFERRAGLLAAGVTTLAILTALHQLFAEAAADPAATVVRAGTADDARGCRAGAASGAGCHTPATSVAGRTARL